MGRRRTATAAAAGAALMATSLTSSCMAMSANAPLSDIVRSNANYDHDDDGVVSLPLLSHHHLVNRRRRELQAAGEITDSDTDNDNPDLDFDRIPNHPQRNGNNLRRLPAQQQLGALYQGYGTHYIDIWVGYPAQRQTAVVDTGSSVTAFPCSECQNCGHHTDGPFIERSSEAFRATHCPQSKDDDGCIFGKCDLNGMCIIEHNFGAPGSQDASSWTAYEAQDLVYAAGPHDRPIDGASPMIDPEVDELNPVHAPEFSFPLTFGCQTSVSGYFEKQLASGVMGLDRRAQSFWGQMRGSQVIHKAQFSLCFVKQPIASASGSTAGTVTLGGVDKRLHKTPMVFAKSVGDGSTASFKVKMRKMYLREGNDMSVMFDAKSKYHHVDVSEEALNGNELYNLDSGTTDTYFIQSFSDEFRKLWKEATGMEYTNQPIKVSKDSDLLKFPTIILQIVPHAGGVGDEVQTADPRTVPGLAGNVDVSMPNDVMLAIPPKHYMQRNSNDGTYTSRIYLNRANELGNVLGANTMMGHDILFDMDEARIGFSESECDYAKLISESATTEISASGEDSTGAGVALNGAQALGDDGSHGICPSKKCRGFFGLTVAVFFCLFFLFARRYVTRREDPTLARHHSSASEYEMKKSSSRTKPRGDSFEEDYSTKASSYYSDEHELPGGERGGYRDNVPPEYSRGSSGRRSGSRESERSSRDGEKRRSSERRSSHDRGERHRSTSRESADNNRSVQSIHSNKSQGSGGSGGSGGSRETRQSSRSNRTSRSHETNRSSRSKESHRSGGSRESHRSRRSSGGGSRESNRSHRSRREQEGRHQHRDGDRDRGEYARQSNRNSYRDDDDDEISRPPSIS